MNNVKILRKISDFEYLYRPEEVMLISHYMKKSCYDTVCVQSAHSHALFFVRTGPHYSTGGMGFLYTDENGEGFHEMLEAGESFLSSVNIKQYYAPMNFNTWYDYRLMSSHHENTLLAGEKATRAYFNRLFEDEGFRTEENYYTFMIDRPETVTERFGPIYEKFMRTGYSISSDIDIGQRDILESIFRISSDAFSRAFMYDPIDFSEFAGIYGAISSEAKVRLTVASKDKEIAGYLYTIFSGDVHVLKTIAVKTDSSGGLAAPSLIYEAYRYGISQGIGRFAHAYMREGISTHNFSKRHGYEYRKYTLYRKNI